MWSVKFNRGAFCWSALCDLLNLTAERFVGLHYVIVKFNRGAFCWSALCALLNFPLKQPISTYRSDKCSLGYCPVAFCSPHKMFSHCCHPKLPRVHTLHSDHPLRNFMEIHWVILDAHISRSSPYDCGWIVMKSPERQYHHNGFIAAKDTTNCTVLKCRLRAATTVRKWRSVQD